MALAALAPLFTSLAGAAGSAALSAGMGALASKVMGGKTPRPGKAPVAPVAGDKQTRKMQQRKMQRKYEGAGYEGTALTRGSTLG